MRVIHVLDKDIDSNSYDYYESSVELACGVAWKTADARDTMCTEGIHRNISAQFWQNALAWPVVNRRDITQDPEKITCLLCLIEAK